jgi:dipeptide/tripeptide permease
MADAVATAEAPVVQKFPAVFWTANLTELFERAAYYSMASFVVIYLGRLGMGGYWPSRLNSGVLWFLVYFLPILSGTIADHVGFKKALAAAFVLLTGGYFLMGYPVWVGGKVLAEAVGTQVTAGRDVFVPIVAGVLLIGIGGSFVKPCVSGTVQKTHGGRATLAFAIFYMVINIGSIVGRLTAFVVRTRPNAALSSIFGVAMLASIVALVFVLVGYKEPAAEARKETRKDAGLILWNMVAVLFNARFAFFLLVSSGFWFIYNQVYNILPLYAAKVVEHNPAMDLYTAANPIMIVCFQLLITRRFGKMKPIRSIVFGTVLIGLAMAINLVPLYTAGGVRAASISWLPIGSLFIILTVACIAFGELFTSARMYEWIGALAPKGQEGLFLGYANLPIAIGAIVSGWVAPIIFNDVMCKGATRRADGLLDLVPGNATQGWLILMTIGFGSALSMWIYNRWLERQPAADARA